MRPMLLASDPSEIDWGAGLLRPQRIPLPPELRIVSRRAKARFAFVRAEPKHIAPIARRMRAADLAEIQALGLADAEAGLRFSLAHATIAVTVLLNMKPVAMFGVRTSDILTRRGVVWLHGTDALDAHPITFARHSRHWRDQLLRRYYSLETVFDTRNEATAAWLRWLGFTVSEPFPCGVNGEPFHFCELRL